MLFDEAIAHLRAGRAIARWDWWGCESFGHARELFTEADEGRFRFDRYVFLKLGATCQGAFLVRNGTEKPWHPEPTDWTSGAWFVLDPAQCVTATRPWWRIWGKK